MHAAHLDFFEQQRLIWWPLAFLSKFGETVVQVAREPVKGIGLGLDATLTRRDETVRGDAEHPRHKTAVAAKRSEMRGHTNHDLLRRILRVLEVPERPEGEVQERRRDSAARERRDLHAA